MHKPISKPINNPTIKNLLGLVLFIMILLPQSVSAKTFSAFAEYLHWYASQQTASIWALAISDINGTNNTNVPNVEFGWQPGFRTGVTYEQECNPWDAKLYWTHYQARATPSIRVNERIVIPQFFSGFLSGNFFFGANLAWTLNKNMFDFELGRKLLINDCFWIRPIMGVKAGNINQSIKAEWDAVIYTATEKLENNFAGIGPSIGLDADWNIYKTLSLVANFSSAFLYGKWNVSDTYSRPSVPAFLITPTTITTRMLQKDLGAFIHRCRIGLSWVFEGSFNTTLQLAYEMQYCPNQLRIATFQQLPVHGDLTLQGGTCRIIIDF